MKLTSKAVTALTLPPGKDDHIEFDDELPRFGYRLRRNDSGKVHRSWIIQYRRAGRSPRMKLGAAEVLSAEQARAAAKKVLAKVDLGEDPQAQKATRRAADRFTLRDLAEQYLAAKEGTVRARTLIEARRYLVGPYFKNLHTLPVDTITRRDVAARVLAISRESGFVTARYARSALSSMFVWGMSCGLTEANPTIGTPQPKTSPPRDHVIGDDELVRIWRACGDDDFGRIVQLLVLTGQRRTEVGGATWEEFEERGTWTIAADRTKNARAHALPLFGLALSVIDSVPRQVGRDHLFGVRGHGFCSWATAKAALDARLGGRVKKWTLHDIRRTVATRMCDLGVAPHIVEQILNHHSGHRSGVAGIYNRSSYEREVKAAMALWSDHVRTLAEGGERKVVPMRQVP